MDLYSDEYSFNIIRDEQEPEDCILKEANITVIESTQEIQEIDSDVQIILTKPPEVILIDSEEEDEEISNSFEQNKRSTGGNFKYKSTSLQCPEKTLNSTANDHHPVKKLKYQLTGASNEIYKTNSNKLEDFGINYVDDDDDEDSRNNFSSAAALDDEENADRKDDMLFDEEFNNDFLYMPQQYNLAANSGLQDLLQNNNQQSTYECPLCSKEVVSKYNLKRHMMIHTGEKPYNCEICNKGFRECSDLRKHKKVHVNGSKLFECKICLRSFATYKAIKCYFCEEENDIPDSPDTELQTEGDELVKRFRCFLCGIHSLTAPELKKHLRLDHPANAPNQTHRATGYTLAQNSTRSVQNMEKIHKCTMCEKAFRSKEFLQLHIQSHKKDIK